MDGVEVVYKEAFDRFHELVITCDSSADLLRQIVKAPKEKRSNLLKLFRRLVSPDTSVEMLKRVRDVEEIISNYGYRFRNIDVVEAKYAAYSDNLEAFELPLMAVLFETQNRGQSGYELTDFFFEWFENNLAEDFTIDGPRGAGKDIELADILPGFDPGTPTDFVIRSRTAGDVVAIGYARYDSDRGGSQEDDRISGNRDKITKLSKYRAEHPDKKIKIIFLNDGPGFVLGSMFRDYVQLEDVYGPDFTMVTTLKMLDERLTKDWLLSDS
ncbi:hypothetical protein CJEDD_03475 [Corynebacterium jeddahense]|uniref:BstEII n=2 Tax=Corynebacterium jeddahense TaxID=1414719 RepID=A0ABY7UJJ6_9CORY|nr:hypothetical protein CJEDD_03475 [Corynebacterium jeddahense]